MKNIKKSILMFSLIFASLFFVRQVIAATGYTKEEVAQHNSSNSCWSIYAGSVYDITTYLAVHNNKYENISSWCGDDITSSFNNIGHSNNAKTLLASFKIGTVTTPPPPAPPTTPTPIPTPTPAPSAVVEEVVQAPIVDTTPIVDTATETPTDPVALKNPYNLLLPLILGIILYWGSLLLSKKNIKNFNGFWNTILFLTFFIPSFGFGVFMMLQYQFPTLMNIDFKFTYWHVEFSVFMGVLAISHFIRRLKIYFMQIKKK